MKMQFFAAVKLTPWGVGGVCYRPLLLDSLIVIMKVDHSNSKSNKHFHGSNFSEV